MGRGTSASRHVGKNLQHTFSCAPPACGPFKTGPQRQVTKQVHGEALGNAMARRDGHENCDTEVSDTMCVGEDANGTRDGHDQNS